MMIPAPPGLAYLPHQIKCIRFCMGARGTIVADDMGLGKTIEAIGVINATTGGVRNDLNVVIICPAFLRMNWHNELDAWMVNSCKVSVISYHQAGNLALDARVDGFDPIDILIVDEAHYIKNPESNRTQDVELIAKYAKRVLLLTGTPMENRPIELWPLLKIACPEHWNQSVDWPVYVKITDRKAFANEGPSFWEYAERYCGLKYVTYTSRGSERKALDYGGASNLDELAKRLRSTCMVRRLKKDVLHDLPDKRRQLIVLESKVDDSDMFPNLDDDSYFDVLDKLKSDKVLFSDWSRRRHEQGLAKVDTALRFIGDVLDEVPKLIVFAHHKDVIAKLVAGLECEVGSDEKVVSITGGIQMLARQIAVDAFQNDPKVRVIVGSIGAMGVGFSLTAASHVIFVELDPVPGRMTQAEDRPHRIGQKESILVQHLVSDGSLCARMARICVRKQVVLSRVLDVGATEPFFRESSENDG